jgi:hypothetical protein
MIAFVPPLYLAEHLYVYAPPVGSGGIRDTTVDGKEGFCQKLLQLVSVRSRVGYRRFRCRSRNGGHEILVVPRVHRRSFDGDLMREDRMALLGVVVCGSHL